MRIGIRSALPLTLLALALPAFPNPAAAARPSAPVSIPADDPGIQYFGRFDQANPKSPRFDWPGCAIQARFTGTSVSVKLSGGNNEFNVFIDDVARPRLSMEPGKTEYTLATGLPAGEHTLLLTKRTEAYYGIVTFSGLVLADGQSLAAPPARPANRILFIGDSFTVGYGADATTLQCASLKPWDNNWLAYGPVAARAVGAEYSVQAISGLGMVHNYNDASPESKEPLPFFFDRTLVGSDQPRWSFASWIPHVVVVALGTNDFSTATKPSQAQYSAAYRSFVKKLRGHYPAAQIICLTYAVDNLQKAYVDALVADLAREGETRISRAHMPALDQSTDLGCDWHPNYLGHRKYADALLPELRKHLAGTWLPRKPAAPESRMGGRIAPWSTPMFRGGEAPEWADASGRLVPGQSR